MSTHNTIEELPDIDVNEFRKVIQTRRSIRKFKDIDIPEEIVQDCLNMALLAPNSSNLQPWDFYLIRKTSGIREKIITACFDQNAAKTSSIMIAVVARTKTWRKHCREILTQWPDEKVPRMVTKYYTKMAPLLYYQGFLSMFGYLKKIIAFIIGLKRPVSRWPFSNADMVTWAVKSCALASENLMLAFRAYGYDTCPLEGFDEKRIKKILKLPADAVTVMIIAAGERTADGIYFPQLRFSRENFIHEA